MEGPLYTEKIEIDRKIFFVDLKENVRGKYLKITEDVGGRRDTIIVPIDAVQQLVDALQKSLDFAETM